MKTKKMYVIQIPCPTPGKTKGMLIDTGYAAQPDGSFGKISNMSVACPLCKQTHPLELDGTNPKAKNKNYVVVPRDVPAEA